MQISTSEERPPSYVNFLTAYLAEPAAFVILSGLEGAWLRFLSGEVSFETSKEI